MLSKPFLELPSQMQLSHRLQQLCGFSSSFIFLSGSEGSGHTAVSEQLIAKLEPKWFVHVVSLKPGMSLNQIRENLVLALAPDSVFDADEPLFETLSRLFLAQHEPQLLIIDHADVEEQTWVSELWTWLIHYDQAFPGHQLSVLLLCSSEMADFYANVLTGRAQPALSIEIDPLSLQEKKKLFMNYLQEGYSGDLDKKKAMIELSSSLSTPGDVVAFAEACMDKHIEEGSPKSIHSINRIAAIVAVCAGVALLLSLVVPSMMHKKAEEANVQPQRQSVETAPDLAPAAANNPASTVTPEEGGTAIQQEGISATGNAQGVVAESPSDDQNKKRVVISDQVINQMGSGSANNVQSSTPVPDSALAANNQQGGVVASGPTSGAQNTGTPATVTTENSVAPSQTNQVNSLQEMKPIVNEIKGTHASSLGSSHVAAHKVTHKAAVKKVKTESKPVVAKKAPVKQQTKVAPAPIVQAPAEPQVMATKPTPYAEIIGAPEKKSASAAPVAPQAGSYTLQLAASGQPESLRAIAQQNGISGKTQVYKSHLTGMYVLIYGHYASAVAAKADIAHLPARIQQAKPWPKSYAQVHKEQQ